MIWIGYTDIHEENTKSLIECRELASNKVLCSLEFEDSIWQNEPFSEGAYVMGNNSVHKFEVEGQKLIEKNNVVCEDTEKGLGGIFSVNKKKMRND